MASKASRGDLKPKSTSSNPSPNRLNIANGSMMASQGYYEYLAGTRGGEDLTGYANRDITLPYGGEGV